MKRNPLYRLLLKWCAPQLVRDLYRGLLGREPDGAGLHAYREQLRATGNLAAVVAEVSASTEAWKRNLCAQPAELLRLFVRGLEGREPDPETVDASAAPHRADPLALLRTVAASRAHWDNLTALRAEELVSATFEALLGRAPDAQALQFYSAQLKEGKSLAWLLSDVAQSPEHWHRQLALKAEEMVRSVYAGLLNREPDAQAFGTYGGQLRENADLTGVVRAVAQSQEHWESLLDMRAEGLVRSIGRDFPLAEPDEQLLSDCVTQLRESRSLSQLWARLARSPAHWQGMLQLKARELAQAACESLLGTEPAAATLEDYAAQLREHRDPARLLATIAASQEHWERLFALRAEELVGAVYQGLLNRAADAPALGEYSAQLRQDKSLAALLAKVVQSAEHWERLLAMHADELVAAVFAGLLNRPADAAALADYSAQLRSSRDLVPLLSSVGESAEHWERLRTLKAEERVREIFQGLLGREPEPEALLGYGAELRQGGRLAKLLAEVSQSDEHWRKMLALKAKEVVAAVYRGLLKREPDASGMISHVDGFWLHRDLTSLVSLVSDSAEYREFLAKDRAWPHPRRSYSKNTLVFLHIEKTAGTSLQNMLRDTFGAAQVYGENRDTLYKRSPGELSMYSVFAGHFNYDSLGFIPRQKLALITFVREPRKRLASLYHFWRAHEPSHPNYTGGVALANRLSIQEFYGRAEVEEDWGIWNHMTWAIMGERRWSEWRVLLADAAGKKSQSEVLARIVRPAIAQRIREFLCVGLQEDFDRSVELLFKILERPVPKTRIDHSLEGLMQGTPGFKRRLPRQRITAEGEATLSRLVALDDIVYSEARIYYAALLAKYPDLSAASRRTAGAKQSDRGVRRVRRQRS